MAGEATFRTAISQPTSSTQTTPKSGDSTVSTAVAEVPYMDYEKSTGYPHSVEFFGLGDTWASTVGGFPEQVGIIEDYFKEKIENGEMANSTNTVKDRLKEILKITNMSKEERNLVKIETVAAYIKFLMESDGISRNVKRYGSTR